MQNHLYQRLHRFNKQIPNQFREKWGSALYYLDGGNHYKGKSYGEVELYNLIDQQLSVKY